MRLPVYLILIAASLPLLASCASDGEQSGMDSEFDILLYKGRAYLERKKPQMALKSLVEARTIHPHHPELLTLMGMAYDQVGRPLLALQALEEVHRQKPNDLSLINNIGVAKLHLNRPKEAIPHFEQVLADPGYHNKGETHFNLSQAYEALGDTEGMVENLKKALAYNPAHLSAHVQMASYYRQNGDLEAERTHLSAVLSEQPDSLVLLERIADSHVESGQKPQAIAIYQAILKQNPDKNMKERVGKRLMVIGVGKDGSN